MKLPQISLETKSIKLGFKINKPTQEIDQTPANLDIKQQKVNIIINTNHSKLNIDQNQAWAEMDLKNVFERTEEAAQLGHDAWLEGIARESQEGDELMRIDKKGNPIADQAITNSVQKPKEYNVGFVPSYGSVKISFSPAVVDIKWQVDKLDSKYTPGSVSHNYNPGNFESEIERWNTLKIDFINLYA